jgi:hypothetical protein
MHGSMIYTMGLALTRAADIGLAVSVLVEGQWLEGRVAAYDGTGLVLEQGGGSHAVVRGEQIAAVTVHSASPFTGESPEGPERPPARPAAVAIAC